MAKTTRASDPGSDHDLEAGAEHTGNMPHERRLDANELALRLAAIVESSDDALISKDIDGTITTWNAAATRLFGYRADEIIGQSILLIVPPEMYEAERANIERIRNGER